MKRFVEKLLIRQNGENNMKTTKNKLGIVAMIAAVTTLLCGMASIGNVHAATIIVTNTADTGPDTPAAGSLRAALASATDGDTIDATGITGTITLMPGATSSAQLTVDKSVTILGPGPANLTVDANHLSRVFDITPGHTVTIDGLAIVNGDASFQFPGNSGGGIFNDHSTLTVSNCTFSGNSAISRGGGIFSDGNNDGVSGSATLTVIACSLSNNSAESGGGICNDGIQSGSATLTVIASTINGNLASSAGGGILNQGFKGNGALTVIASTISSNSAAGGGGIFSEGADFGSATLTIVNSTLSGNSADSASGNGGGIYNFGRSGSATLTVTASTISGNSAGGGGGIYNNGGSSISNCIVSGNSAGGGGGIFNDGSDSGSATFMVSTTMISSNLASTGVGGGISNDGESGSATLTVVASTINGNSARDGGGGIHNDGSQSGSAPVTMSSSTLSDNSGNDGGGIFNNGDGSGSSAPLKINASTFSGNSAGTDTAGTANPGGIHNFGISSSVEIGDTILNAGASGENIVSDPGATVISRGYNLSSDNAGGGPGTGPGGLLNGTADQRNTDPLLGPLQDNGGPTFTHALLPNSPAIDKGKRNAIPALALNTDQRGFPRPMDFPTITNAAGGDGSDIGAFEVQGADLLVSLGVDKTSVKQGEQLTYTITVHNFGPDAAANVVVNDALSSGTTFVSAQANKGTFTKPPVGQTGTVTWAIGNMQSADEEAAQIKVTVLVKGKTTVTNTATVSSDSADPNPANNTASITVSVAAGTTGKKK